MKAFILKVAHNDPVSFMTLVVMFLALLADLCLCMFVKTTVIARSANISMLILACSVGSLLGMLASPYTKAEKAGFSSTAKLATAFLAGLFTETVRSHVAETCFSGNYIFPVSTTLSGAILSFSFVYLLRTYVVQNNYEEMQ